MKRFDLKGASFKVAIIRADLLLSMLQGHP
jgi:hypothetical protein